MENQELQVVESSSTNSNYVPSLSMTPAMANQLIQQLDQLKKEVLRNKVDYDVVPGTEKPSLLKPGAERLLMCFGLGHRVHEVRQIEDWENGFFHYVYKVTIHKSYPTHEIVVAECIGSANSKESKYNDRWVFDSEVREMGLNINNLEKKQRISKKTKKPYFVYKVVNPDPYSIVNTLQKMAIKRALVGATLQATGTSEFFTQDLEDMKPNQNPPNQPDTSNKNQSNTKKGNSSRNQTTTSTPEQPAYKMTGETLNKIKDIWESTALAPELINKQTDKYFKLPLNQLTEEQGQKLLEIFAAKKSETKEQKKNRYAALFAAGKEQRLSQDQVKELVYDKYGVTSLTRLGDAALENATNWIKSGGKEEKQAQGGAA